MMVIAENIWDQIGHNDLWENLMRKERVNTALHVFTYSYIEIFDTQFLRDKNKMKMLKQLWQDCIIYPNFDQLLTLPALFIITMENFYHPSCSHKHKMIIILNILSMLLIVLDQYYPSYLINITSLFLLISDH